MKENKLPIRTVAYTGKRGMKRDKKRGRIQYIILFIVFLSIILMYNGTSPAVEIEGSVLIDSVWTEDMSPYVISGNLTVAEDVTLKIEPGVVIRLRFSDPNNVFYIEVKGTLDARGSADNPILFTTEDKGHYWGYIEFTQESAPWDEVNASGCILSHCIIEYGGNKDKGTYGKAAIISMSASPLIRRCIIRYSKSDGILTNAGVQNIVNNRIHDTTCGIKLITPKSGLIENNYLINNEQGIYIESGANEIIIRKNTVKSSSSEILGGCLGIHLLYYDNLASYFWEQIAGPDVTPSDSNDVTPFDSNDVTEHNLTFTAPNVSKDELLSFQLTVTDKAGLLSVDTVNVEVKGENMPPVADAGPDQTLKEGMQVVLDGSNSIDPDGGNLSYEWEQTSGPEVSLSDAFSVHCTFTAPQGAGAYGEMYIFQLTVTDNGSLQSKDTVNIHVIKDDQNKPPDACAGSEQMVIEGNSVVLDGSETIDPENAIISWMWQQVEGPYVDITDFASQEAGFTAPEVGLEGKSLIFMLTVTDDAFQESSDMVIVNVIDSIPNDRHLPLLANAGSYQEVIEGSNVTLKGLAKDPNGTIDYDPAISYNWERLLGPSVTFSGTGTNRFFTAPDVTEDEKLIFRLTITDTYGLKSADRVTVKVKWVNEGPVADAGPDLDVEEGIKVLLDGSASEDPDDGIAIYLWEQISGPEVILSSISVVKPVLTAPDVLSNNRLIFRLTVTDRNGESAQDFMNVNITSENKQPVTDAGQDMVVEWGTDVTLDGSGSYDPEDPNHGIVSYLWEEEDRTTVTLYDADTAHPHFMAPQQEEGEGCPSYCPEFQSLTFLLIVKDKDGMESSDAVVVNVTGYIGSNQVPISNAGPDQKVATGSTITLDGSGSRDPDIISGVTVNNNHFINNDSEEIGNAIAIKEDMGANALLSITSNNLENINGNFMVYLYNWADEDSGPIDMTGNWWSTASLGEIDSMLYDHDDDEYVPQVNYDQAMSAEITGVGSDLLYPPIADAGEDKSVKPDDIVTLEASKTYDTDNIMSYEWMQTEGETVILHDAKCPVSSFIAPSTEKKDEDGTKEVGTLIFKLTVTDPEGFYDTDEIIVTIAVAEEQAKRQPSSGCFISSTVPVLKTGRNK